MSDVIEREAAVLDAADEQSQGVMPVPESQAEAEPAPNTVTDEQTGAIIDADTGEVLGYVDAPLANSGTGQYDTAKLVDYLSEKLGREQARLAAMVAERDKWLQRISNSYDSRINEAERRVAWIRAQYSEPLREYAARELAGKKARSLKVGLLVLQFRSSRASVEVVNPALAVGWLRKRGLKNAIKTTESVLIRELPDEVLKDLTTDETGMQFHPAGEVESFEVL